MRVLCTGTDTRRCLPGHRRARRPGPVTGEVPVLRTGVVVAVRGSVAQAWSDACSGCYRSGCSMCKREREYDFMQSLRNPGGDPDGRFAAAPHLSAGSCRFHGDEWRGAAARRCLRAQQTLQQRTHQGGTLSRSRPMRPVYDFASKRAPHQTTQRGVSHRACRGQTQTPLPAQSPRRSIAQEAGAHGRAGIAQEAAPSSTAGRMQP